MLKLITENLGFSFTNDNDEVFFPLKLINRKNIAIENQTTLLNAYFEYKGKKWYTTFFNIMKDVHTEITFSTSSKVLINIDSLQTLIDYIDMADIEHFLVNVYKIKPPKDLIKSFTDDMKAEGRWNEEQTYTITDYINLATETVRLKILVGPLCYYAYLNHNKLNKDLIEYVTVRLHLGTILEESPALTKVKNMVTKLIDAVDKQIVVIEKKLPEEELGKYVTYIAIIQRIATATIVEDTQEKNIIKYIYGYCNNKLINSGDISKMIRPKITVSNDDSSGGAESASVLESYKTVTKVTKGELIEPIWATETIDAILHNSPDVIRESIDVTIVHKVHKTLIRFFDDAAISTFSTKICKLIFGNTINQRSIETEMLENMVSMLAIGDVYIKSKGYPNIAELLISKEMEFTEISYKPRDKKEKILFSKLNKIYFDKGEKYIDGLVELLSTSNWVSPNGPVEIDKEIVNNLAKLYIEQEEELYKNNK